MDFEKTLNSITNNRVKFVEESYRWTCSICQKELKPTQVPFPNGKIKYATYLCKCEADIDRAERAKLENATENNRLRNLFSVSDVGGRNLNFNFDSYIPREGSERALRISKRFADEFDPKEQDALMLYGEPGNGKTTLAACIYNQLVSKGHTVVFISMPDLLSKIKATFNKNSTETETQIMKALSTCELLIIDDLGAEKTSDWVQEKIFEIIDNRYRNKKPILCTSNLHPMKIEEQIGKRSADRLLHVCIPVKNEATSYRMEELMRKARKYD